MYTLVPVLRMSIGQYFAPRDGFPDFSGSLSGSILSQSIACANREVARVLKHSKNQAWLAGKQ